MEKDYLIAHSLNADLTSQSVLTWVYTDTDRHTLRH